MRARKSKELRGMTIHNCFTLTNHCSFVFNLHIYDVSRLSAAKRMGLFAPQLKENEK